jgi:hypothetical protein
MSDPIRDIFRMKYIAERQKAQNERYLEKRRRKGLPEFRKTTPAENALVWIITLVIIAAIAAAVVGGAILIIRYGYAHHWWW